MFEENRLSYYINKDREISKSFENKIRVAILSSFTVNGIEETLRVKCSENKIQCNTYMAGYNQYNQEILDSTSSLYKFNPDITILILDTKSILGDLFYNPYSINEEQRKIFVKQKSTELINLFNSFFKHSNSKLIVTNMSVPSYSVYGICENKEKYGLQEMIYDFNNILKSFENPSLYVYNFNGFISKHGEKNVVIPRQVFFGNMIIALNYIPYLVEDFMGYVKPILGLNKKCIVLDLDNTLWGGIVGEDGFDGIQLGPNSPGNAFVEFQKLLLSLNQRGILLSINSKNNYNDAIEVIQKHPHMILREENFASIQINWNNKVSNMEKISEELNLGLDSFVFFDDDPVNREFVKTTLPEIHTVQIPIDPSLYAKTLQELNDFNVLKITGEDTKRSQMYLQQKKRNELSISNSLEDFLKQLEIKVNLKNANQSTIPRISQLTLKTNQFNLRTKRYQEKEISTFSEDKNFLIRCVEVIDKFGNNGITGVFIIKKNNSKEWFLDNFILSCRVMGRKIEHSIMSHIIDEAKKENVEKLIAEFIPTTKNMPSEDFLESCGFKKENNYWIYVLNKDFKSPEHVTIDISNV